MIKAIETVYRGCRFRSRAEARWAVFFDALGIKWEYEPEGYQFADGTRYLPDFLLPREFGGLFVEVKGAAGFNEVSFAKSIQMAKDGWCAVLCVWGCPDAIAYRLVSSAAGGGYNDANGYFRGGSFHTLEAPPFLPDTMRVNCEKTKAAVDAARSARFEFGESGAGR